MHHLTRLSLRFPAATLVVLLGLTLAFGAGLARLRTDVGYRAFLGADHPSLVPFGGFDVRNVTIRTPSNSVKGVQRRTAPPVLEMAVVDNVVGVFFSPLDLSCALESPNSVQCPGYSTQDAAKIITNLILYALQQ